MYLTTLDVCFLQKKTWDYVEKLGVYSKNHYFCPILFNAVDMSNGTYEEFQESLNDVGDNYFIMEDQVDVKIQTEYFQCAHKYKKNPAEVLDLNVHCGELLNPLTDLARKRQLLIIIASSSEVPAFRCLESYLLNPDDELLGWALLAKNECRLHMQTTFTDQQLHFISSGLGGKLDKLRYQIVLYPREKDLKEYQQRVIEVECESVFGEQNCVIEKFEKNTQFVSMIILIPVRSDIRNCLFDIIENINVYGDFLSDRSIITNIKLLSNESILRVIEKRRNNEKMDVGISPEDPYTLPF